MGARNSVIGVPRDSGYRVTGRVTSSVAARVLRSRDKWQISPELHVYMYINYILVRKHMSQGKVDILTYLTL